MAVLVGKTDDKITMAVTVNKLAQEKGLKAGVLVKEISAKMCIRDSAWSKSSKHISG